MSAVYESLLAKNMVNGFDPYQAVVGYPSADGAVKVAMPAVVAMQWFLARYEGGSVDLKMNEKFSTDSYAVYECALLDAQGNKIGIPGVGCCQFNNLDAVHASFVQTAQTKAIACALRNNGFCAPFDAEYKEKETKMIGGAEAASDPMVGMEMPIVPPPSGTPLPIREKKEETKRPANTEENGTQKAEKTPIRLPKREPSPLALAEMGRLHSQLENQMKAKGKEMPAPIQDDPEPPTSDEEPNATPETAPEQETVGGRPDWALNTVIRTGSAKGMTIQQAYEKMGGGIIRYFTKEVYAKESIYKAAKAACKFYGV